MALHFLQDKAHARYIPQGTHDLSLCVSFFLLHLVEGIPAVPNVLESSKDGQASPCSHIMPLPLFRDAFPCPLSLFTWPTPIFPSGAPDLNLILHLFVYCLFSPL